MTTVNIAVGQEIDSVAIEAPVKLKERELQIFNQQWNITENAAGLGINKISNSSLTTIGLSRSTGDFHRAQEGSSFNRLEFNTDRFDKFNDQLSLVSTKLFVLSL